MKKSINNDRHNTRLIQNERVGFPSKYLITQRNTCTERENRVRTKVRREKRPLRSEPANLPEQNDFTIHQIVAKPNPVTTAAPEARRVINTM